MTSAVNVVLVETDELESHERTEQLLMDGYAVDAVSGIDQARVEPAEGPDALSGGPETISLLRELRAGEIPRADSRLPVLVLGVDDDSAAVRYYRAGADVALPSGTSGLLVAAGLEALARRASPPETPVVRVGSLTVKLDARIAQVENRAVKLTRLEFDLLATLASEPRRTFTRAELTREVWGYDPQAAGPSRTVDSHAHRLRQKLEHAGAEPMVQTVRGVGWRPRPMTTTRAAVAARASRRPSHVVGPPHGSSRDRSRVSHKRNGWPQIQPHIPETGLPHAMISVMHELPYHLLAGWSSDTAGYTSTYSPAFTDVDTHLREVS